MKEHRANSGEGSRKSLQALEVDTLVPEATSLGSIPSGSAITTSNVEQDLYVTNCWTGHYGHWWPLASKLGDPCFCGKETMSLYDLSRIARAYKSRGNVL